jgi:hypothetical protein
MIYKDFKRNHVVLPGREKVLEKFLKQDYKGMRHKWKNSFSSNSEDALTWSCFDLLSNLPFSKKISVLDDMLEDAYPDKCDFTFRNKQYSENQIEIYIGKQYTGLLSKETTEVDASIELPDKLIFFEAKLYSTVSMANPDENKPYDQIARKLRIGVESSLQNHKEFYFIFLDIAPLDILMQRKSKLEALSPAKKGFYDKWKSAWLFNYYKCGKNGSLKPLKEALNGIAISSVKSVASNMGWLTWSDLFKSLLRGII